MHCSHCGSENIEVALEHKEGERVFCFDCAGRTAKV
jgi:hypothetical protein